MSLDPPSNLAERPTYRDRIVPFIAASSDGDDGQSGGTVNFKETNPVRWAECANKKLCAACGRPLDYWIVFLGPPKSERAFKDPPMHEDCAHYLVRRYPKELRARFNSDLALFYRTRSFEVRKQTGRKIRVLFHAAPAKETMELDLQT